MSGSATPITEELAIRIDDAAPKVVVSASCGIEGSRVELEAGEVDWARSHRTPPSGWRVGSTVKPATGPINTVAGAPTPSARTRQAAGTFAAIACNWPPEV